MQTGSMFLDRLLLGTCSGLGIREICFCLISDSDIQMEH